MKQMPLSPSSTFLRHKELLRLFKSLLLSERQKWSHDEQEWSHDQQEWSHDQQEWSHDEQNGECTFSLVLAGRVESGVFVSVVIVLLVSVKMAPAWRSVTLSPFSTFTQSTKSHKAQVTQSHTQGHTKHMANCHSRCTTTVSHRHKVHHHTRHTVTQGTQSHMAQSHIHSS